MYLVKRTNGIYYIKYFDESGSEKRVSTKQKKKSEAIKFLTTFRKEIDRKSFPPEISFTKQKELYLNYCESNFSKSYYTIMKGTLEAFFNGDPQHVKKSDVESFITNKLIKGKLYAAHQDYRNLRTFFNWSMLNDYIKSSPMEKMKPPKLPQKRPAWITAKQLETILSKEPKQQLRDIYSLLFYTGLRANELLTLNWENIDLENKQIHIVNQRDFRTKTLKERTVPLNGKAFELISMQPTKEIGGLLFIKNSVKINVDYVSKKFKKAVLETNIDKSIHLHSLRHSFASNLIRMGNSIYKVSKLLGHERLATTEIYSHLQPNDLVDTVNSLK